MAFQPTPLKDIGKTLAGQSGSFFNPPTEPTKQYVPVQEPTVVASSAMPQATIPTAPVKPKIEPALLSTAGAATQQKQLEAKLDAISGVDKNLFLKAGETPEQYKARTEAYFAAKKPAQPVVEPTKPAEQPRIKMLNLEGQSTELVGGAITPEAMQSLKNQGYYSIETTGEVPTWAASGDIETGKANAELAMATKAKNDLMAGLEKFTISDEELNRQVQAISGMYDSRIKDMENINTRRKASVKTLGVRTGSRYTGGEGGVFGGIIAEEERQGVNRIADLESQKQMAISAAKEAQRTNNWKIYSVKVDAAEKAYSAQKEAVAKLNEKIVENNKKIKEKEIQSSRDSAITDLISQGITDPAQLIEFLNFDEQGKSTGGGFTFKEVNDIASVFKKEKEKPIGYDDLRKINNSVEGLNLPFGTTESDLASFGIVPSGKTADDYNYQTVKGTLLRIDKNTGEQKVVYQAPAEADPFTTAQMFNNAFGMAKEVQNASKEFITVRDSYERIKASPKSDKDSTGPSDMSLIFSYMRLLDPNTGVKEGEYATAENAASIPSRVRAQYKKAVDGKKLDEKTRNEFIAQSKKLYDAQLESQIYYQGQQVDFAESFGLDSQFAAPDFTNIKQKFAGQLKKGEIIVWDKSTKKAGAIPSNEFDSSKYIRF